MVPAGSYDVSATASGFQTQVRSGITMTVGATPRVEFSMSVGAVQQEVTVTGEAPQVDTTTSTMSGLVGETAVRELPLNGRDWLQLGALQPGVLTIGSRGSGSVTQGMGLSLSIAGGPDFMHTWQVHPQFCVGPKTMSHACRVAGDGPLFPALAELDTIDFQAFAKPTCEI